MTPDPMLTAGLARHRADDPGATARCYHHVLQRANDHVEAWHMLGLAHVQSGDHANAPVLINRALALDPRHADARANLGLALQRLGVTP